MEEEEADKVRFRVDEDAKLPSRTPQIGALQDNRTEVWSCSIGRRRYGSVARGQEGKRARGQEKESGEAEL